VDGWSIRNPKIIAQRRDDYLARAADAEMKAGQSADKRVTTAWIQIAQIYRDLAKIIDQNLKL
jgi:hypothetical protein